MSLSNLIRASCLLACALLVLAPAYGQSTWYVDDDNCPGPGTGTTGDPFCKIQIGINAATNGDTVIVADGIYTGIDNQRLNFSGRLITLRSANGPEYCTIDCEHAARGFRFLTGETAAAIVEGFKITNCEPAPGGNGGGMLIINNSSPTINDCIFEGNHVTGGATTFSGLGGGLYCDGSEPTITNCIFRQNSATAGTNDHTGIGAGVYLIYCDATIRDCSFIDNTATGGAFIESGLGAGLSCGICSPRIENCDFIGNTVIAGTAPLGRTGMGGGMVSASCNPTLVGCTFSGNSALGNEISHTGMGGGFWCANATTPELTNCSFIENSATGDGFPTALSGIGGGILATKECDMMLANCTFIGNSASNEGGGLYNLLGSSSAVTNCTFSENEATSGGSIYSTDWLSGLATTPTVNNSILWRNSPPEITDYLAAVTTVNYSDVQGGWTGSGSNNMNVDPLFVDAQGADSTAGTADDDLRLAAGSPCIDAADNSTVPADSGDVDSDGSTGEQIPFDHDGQPRLVDDPNTGPGSPPIVDLGAYEYPHGNLIAFGSDGDTISWPMIGGAVFHNMYRGDLSDLVDGDSDGLPDGGYGECVNYLDSVTSDTLFVDGGSPDPGNGYFYMMCTVDTAGRENYLGKTSAGLARAVLVPCP
jgi:predicted outer membrane repeat protein